MRAVRTRTAVAAAALLAVAALAGCGGDEEPKVSATSVAPVTATTRPAAALRAALLSAPDLPGATESTASPDDLDLAACFPGNPLGAKADPNEVDSPDFDLTQRGVERSYSSSARQATPEQASAFVAALLTPAGTECVLNAIKAAINEEPPAADVSGLKATATKAAVGDGGATVAVRGVIKGEGRSARIEADMVAFAKGPVVVLITASAIDGAVVPDQGVELAQKVAGRL